jgi:signal transduction histidine kinase
MLRCKFCDREAVTLIRTARRVWLGCPHCYQTWEIDAQQAEMTSDIGMVSDAHAIADRSPLRGYLIAVLAVALALSLRLVLRPALGNASPFLLFTPAVAIAAIYGGLPPGALATFLSTLLGSHFFLVVPGEPAIEKWDRVILFMIVGSVITVSTSLVQRSRQQLAASLWREQKARATAEAADRTKDDFLALISHELRTPMSVILGWMSAIRQQRVQEGALHHAFEVVERNAQILSRLIDDMLDRSRIATGTLRLDLHPVSLTSVVHAALEQMAARIEAADLLLYESIPETELPVYGDAVRLQQVLTNLLSNAIKFTPKGGHLSVEVVASDDAARVTVADNGVGITPELLPHIFDPFRQGQETLAQSHQGLGLGLAISRYLIQQHRGSIVADSEGPGSGAAFTITLPLVDHPVRALCGVEAAGFDEGRRHTAEIR